MPRIKSSRKFLEDIPPIRTGGRLKKARVVYDPSEHNKPRRRMGRTMSMYNSFFMEKTGDEQRKKVSFKIEESKQQPTLELHATDSCMICGKTDGKRGKKLIPCKDCNYKVHISCLKINFQNLNLLEEHWRCNNCRTCVVCYETSEAGILITCCVCVDAYHLNCHNPKIISKTLNKLKWECYKCQSINKAVSFNKFDVDTESNDIQITEIKTESDFGILLESPSIDALNTILDMKAEPQEINDEREVKIVEIPNEDNHGTVTIDEDIPDISDWSCEKVSKYIEKYFPDEASIFREQEIDGSSLLLMKRSDVVRGFPFKLGPAIRLYSFIVRLQTKSNDPRLTWM